MKNFLFFLIFLIFCSSSRLMATEGYYKDLFVDGGIYLTERSSLYAADYLGLSMEYLATETQSIQDQLIISNTNDDNGVLLYPDGEPRFRCIQINGGAATGHGNSLGSQGRERIRDFYFHGGSYTGTCAGAFVVCNGFDDYDRTAYLHIWPARAKNTTFSNIYTGHFIPSDSPLLNYYDFGDDLYIDNVRHNSGCYTIEDDSVFWTPGTEALLRYDYPSGVNIHNNVSCWAYKGDVVQGRLVAIGSHPEGESSGEKRDLMAAILSYAIDGNGLPDFKASLENGIPWEMNDNNVSGHEKIGDKQYHHFKIDLPSNIKQLTVSIDGEDSYDLDMFLKKGDFAFRGDPEVIEAENNTSADETINIDNPSAGEWYIGVKCYTTVDTTEESWGYSYSGDVEVLNGIEYTITAEYELSEGSTYWIIY